MGISKQLKNFLKPSIDPWLLGFLDYWRSDERDRDCWRGPFNGQRCRQDLVRELCRILKVSFIVETGSFRGVTTKFLADQTNVPIFTCEVSRRNMGFTAARTLFSRDVHRLALDSRSALRFWLATSVFPKGVGFFYLDAHWHGDLPLIDEIEIIFTERPESLVMVDDFEVPGDQGYQYDDYGDIGRLTWEYISPVMHSLKLHGFVPACSSSLESGARRGCAVLVKSPVRDALIRLPSLRPIQ